MTDFLLRVACSLSLLGCAVVKPGPGVPEDKLRTVARQLVVQLPAKSRVVVSNFTRLGGAQGTMLGVYLAKRFGVALAAEAGKKLQIIDRELGAKSVMEEMRFTVDRQSAGELLKHFQADYAVMATYDLGRTERGLDLVELKACSTAGAEVPFTGACLLSGSTTDYAYWQKLEGQLLPNVSPRLARFFTGQGKWDALETPRLELADGTPIPANGEIATGALWHARLKVREPCFVYALSWDQTNAILTVLFPTRNEAAALSAGSALLPPKGVFRADPPAGYNTLKLIATRSDIGLQATGEAFVRDPQVQEAVVDSIESQGAQSWGSASVGYYISDK